MSSLGKMKVGFVGGGKMAEAIIKGLIEGGIKNILVYDTSTDRLKFLTRKYKIRTVKSNADVVSDSDVILLAVKPVDVKRVCADIKDRISHDKIVISVAAGVTLSFLRYLLGTDRVVRVMPNTPAFVGKGMTVIVSSPSTKKKDIAVAEKMFAHAGEILVMSEKHIDAVTAISGSGPAFVSLFVEALVDGAVRMGIQRNHALKLVVKTVEGTVAMLSNGVTTSQMREMVTSPGGTTAEGLFVLEREGFKGLMVDAVESAREKASEIAHQVTED